MSTRQTDEGAPVRAPYQTYRAEGVATTDEWADVPFTVTSFLGSVARTVLPAAQFISGHLVAWSSTQATKVRVLAQSAEDAPWWELVTELDVPVQTETSDLLNGVTEVLEATVRAHALRVQVKEGSSSGGAISLAGCLK